MKEYKVPVQSLIDHIKTATDVDPWAKEMAEELLKEQEAEIAEISDEYLDLGNEIAKMPKAVRCEDCEYSYTEGFVHQHLFCEKHPELGEVADDWFCADGWKA